MQPIIRLNECKGTWYLVAWKRWEGIPDGGKSITRETHVCRDLHLNASLNTHPFDGRWLPTDAWRPWLRWTGRDGTGGPDQRGEREQNGGQEQEHKRTKESI